MLLDMDRDAIRLRLHEIKYKIRIASSRTTSKAAVIYGG